jgi:hypothetical protein
MWARAEDAKAARAKAAVVKRIVVVLRNKKNVLVLVRRKIDRLSDVLREKVVRETRSVTGKWESGKKTLGG